ncbi:MAG: polysaccharide deacetylase family protein, partial [Ruminococcus sp.]|nr:polysaccharide deacetylase family protein [Ruminococcus sp.]
IFVPGNSYSLSVAVMQNKTASEDFKLTLQYDKDGETNYSTFATATGAKGEWVQLANTSYTIPAGATNLIIYTETDGTTTDYFMDEAIGAEKGKVIDFSSYSSSKLGDLNGDGKIDVADLQELQNFILGKKATATLETSDMNSDGVINSFDLVLLRQTVLNPQQSTPSTPVATGSVDISWIDPSKPMVAISFDDGAVGTDANSSSMRILNALKNSGFHATFFYVSDWIRNNQAEVKTAYDMGMEVANHTKSHPNLSEKSASEIRSEYDSCATALKNIIGTEPSKLLRLPYLASNDTVKSTLSDVPLITCSIDTQDWNGATTSQIIDTVKNAMSNGSLNNAIVLCHETYDSTAEAMEYLCPYLKEQGWQIVTVSELFAVNGKELNGGQIYTKCN